MAALVISAPALSSLQSAIIAALHGMTGLDGKRCQLGTVNDRTLRQAALCAAAIASGETILPGDESIMIEAPAERSIGPFRFQTR
jgi:hypothetical protein